MFCFVASDEVYEAFFLFQIKDQQNISTLEHKMVLEHFGIAMWVYKARNVVFLHVTDLNYAATVINFAFGGFRVKLD